MKYFTKRTMKLNTIFFGLFLQLTPKFNFKNTELRALRCLFTPPPPMRLKYKNCFSPIRSY